MTNILLTIILVFSLLLRLWPINYATGIPSFTFSQFQVFFPSAFVGTISLLLFFLVIRANMGKNLGLVCVLALSANPWHIAFSQQAFAPMLSIAMILFSIWRHTSATLLVSALAYLPFAPFSLALFLYSIRERLKKYTKIFIFLLSISIMIVFGANLPLATNITSFISPETLSFSGKTVVDSERVLQIGLFNYLEIALLITGVVLVPTIIWVSAICIILLSSFYPPSLHQTQLIFLLYPLITIISYTLIKIIDKNKLLGILCVALYIILIAQNLDLYYFHLYPAIPGHFTYDPIKIFTIK